MPSATLSSRSTETLARILPTLTVVAALLLAVAAYAFLFIPKIGRMVPGGDLDLEPFRTRVEETEQYGLKVRGMQSAYAAIDATARERVQRMVPAETETQSLYVMFEQIAAANGAVLTGIDASGIPDSMDEDGMYVVSGNISVSGLNYQQFKRFLFDLESSERIVDIQSLLLGSGTVDHVINFRAYAFNPDRLWTAAAPAPGSLEAELVPVE